MNTTPRTPKLCSGGCGKSERTIKEIYKCHPCRNRDRPTPEPKDDTPPLSHKGSCTGCEKTMRVLFTTTTPLCRPCLRDSIPHGTTRYQKLKCRCVICREAKVAEVRRSDQRRKASTGISGSQATKTKRRNRTDEEVLADRNRLRPDGLKKCRGCGPQPFSSFHGDRNTADGLTSHCNPCASARKSLKTYGSAYERWGSLSIPLICVYCSGPFEHVDHIIPQVLGGTNDPENLIPACGTCNTSKNGTPLEDWYPRYAARNGLTETLQEILTKIGGKQPCLKSPTLSTAPKVTTSNPSP